MVKIENFKQLKIWQKGIEVVKDVYTISRKFPKVELYCLTSQMRRAAISIPSNVAEGFKRFYDKEYKQFLNIALGSCAELETQLIVSRELEYVSGTEFEKVSEKIDHISKMITSLKRKLK
ncbi:MAG: four helix bundle protein [Candidatus Omnitrophica bacterium]|nr:four helix bundle protein [Candidatus Omnitrophota bacterium]